MCAQCKSQIPPHITLACNDAGDVHVVAVDVWPTYFWDTLNQRDEFCSAACVLNYVKQSK